MDQVGNNPLLSARILEWVSKSMGTGAVIECVNKLTGSTSSSLYSMEITYQTIKMELVLRLLAGSFSWKYFTYNEIKQLTIPDWSSFPAEWGKVIRILHEERPKTVDRFIHRDFHPANVLWADNKVSGIVDWINACRGPAGIDIGHCRLNLALLHGVETADQFQCV